MFMYISKSLQYFLVTITQQNLNKNIYMLKGIRLYRSSSVYVKQFLLFMYFSLIEILMFDVSYEVYIASVWRWNDHSETRDKATRKKS